MPRTSAAAGGAPTGGAGQAASGMGRKRTLQAAKTAAAVRQTRAALGEITNAVTKGQQGQEAKKSLTSQVKRGLSNIVRRRSSRNQEQPPKLVKQPSNPGSGSRSRPKRTASSASAASSSSFHLSFGSSSSQNSLPSSQEEESVRKLQEKLRNERDLLDLSTSSDEESYHSASEGNEEPTAQPSNYRYVPPARVIPPENVKDFDLENMDDPSTCSEYAADIFQYYKDREAQFAVPDYLSTQPDITEMMRAILVDWLVEVQESFELNHETLYTAVKLMDTYMSRRRVTKDQLQLVGATAALIACKTDERIPPNLDDFVYVCDDAYTRRDIVRKELEMVEVAGFDVGYPLSYRFLRRFGRVCMVNMPDLTFARFILETSLTVQAERGDQRVSASRRRPRSGPQDPRVHRVAAGFRVLHRLQHVRHRSCCQ